MADPKNTLDVVARTHAFTVTLVTTRQDSLGTGKVTKVREGGPTTIKGSGTKQLWGCRGLCTGEAPELPRSPPTPSRSQLPCAWLKATNRLPVLFAFRTKGWSAWWGSQVITTSSTLSNPSYDSLCSTRQELPPTRPNHLGIPMSPG